MTTPKRNEAVAPIAYGWTKADGVTPFMQHDGMPLVNYWPPKTDPAKGGGNVLIPLYPKSAIDALHEKLASSRETNDALVRRRCQMDDEIAALQGEVSRLRAKVESARVLADHWQGMAAESWGEDKRDAALQSCHDELIATLNLEPPTDGR